MYVLVDYFHIYEKCFGEMFVCGSGCDKCVELLKCVCYTNIHYCYSYLQKVRLLFALLRSGMCCHEDGNKGRMSKMYNCSLWMSYRLDIIINYITYLITYSRDLPK